MRTLGLILLAPCLSATALAMPLHPERGYGGALSGPAWASPASTLSNPAALPWTGPPQVLVEGDLRRDWRSVETHRHNGIDSNTQRPYELATSEQWLSGGFLGFTWPVAQDRLVLGLSLASPQQLRLDYRDDPDGDCMDTPTRYAVVAWESDSLILSPAMSVRVIDGIHLGGSLHISRDQMSVVQAWDPLGTEGMGPGNEQPGFVVPYSNDVVLEASMSGLHMEWTGGLWIHRLPFVRLGASYTHRQPMELAGSGTAAFPPMAGGETVDSVMSLSRPLASELSLGLSSEADRRLRGSVSWVLERWEACCESKDSDVLLTMNAAEGGPIGPDQGIIVEVSEEFYQPQRLKDSMYFSAGVVGSVVPRLDLGLHASWQTPAIEDFALNALQQDYETLDLGLHSSVRLREGLHLGLSYVHRRAQSRTIENSAWDVRSITAEDLLEDYVDERFSPQLPYVAGANGEYAHQSQLVSLRLELRP